MVLDGYIRVSQVRGRKGDRFISPAVQREQIEAWTSSHNAVLGEVFEELDQSGGRADRPLLMAAIERIEAGESDGLVVAKLDRFGRSLIDGLRALARIEAAGGTFVSVQDGIDISTPTGRLVSRILFAIGEWEIERMRTNWDSARGRAVERGVYICRRAPPGYVKGENGRLEVDPNRAPLIREVFDRRIRGQSLDEIADFLNASELETESGGSFQAPAITKLIGNCAYRGEARSGTHRNPNAHEPIVDPATWQTAQGKPRAPRASVDALLIGMVRCAGCGRVMTATRPQGRKSKYHVYRCYGHRFGCTAPAAMSTEELDPLVEEYMFRVCCRKRPPSAGDEAVEKCEAAVDEAEVGLAAYRDNPRLLRTLGPESFEEGVVARRRRVEKRLLELARARRALRRPRVKLGDLEPRWPELGWTGWGEAAAELIDCVVIARGAEPAIERTWIFRRGRGPLAVELEGPVPTAMLKRKGARLREPRRWSERRITAELKTFLEDRETWPTYLEFAESGRSRLHAQVMAYGGPHFWGARLGFAVAGNIVKWNERRLRAALIPILAGRDDWPRRAELKASGLLAIYRAVRSHGGIAHWAEEFGVTHHATSQVWSKQRVEDELVAFLDGRTVMPSREMFDEAEQGPLYSALAAHGGKEYWLDRLGLRSSSGPLDHRPSRTRQIRPAGMSSSGSRSSVRSSPRARC
jgi:DNA invertase Pin-like site-specific DNA recombinase